MKLNYAVVYQKTPNNYCAYPPDLPGCVSTGETWEDVQGMIREAITFHIECMMEHGDPLPEKPMSLEEAMSYHNEPLSEHEAQILAEYGDAPPALSTTFEMVEVEVVMPQGAKSGA